jgi:hypothetical protein
MADVAEATTETKFDYNAFLAELDQMCAEEALYALTASSADVIRAWERMFDSRQDGATQMGTLFASMMRRVERRHGTIQPAERRLGIPIGEERLIPAIDMNWGAVAEHYLFTIESVRGRTTVDWAMEFVVGALVHDRPKDVSLAVSRTRQFFGPDRFKSFVGATPDFVEFS